MKTSLSDNQEYPGFCALAAENDEIFKSFKRNPTYNAVLEHVTYKQGKGYLKVIISQTPELINLFDKFRENDKYGNPYIYNYGKYGMFSPTTLRYIKVLSDLKIIFKDFKNIKIIEIGGGYGGQCKIISDCFNVNSYTFVDLKPVLNLAKKYLDKFENKNVSFLSPDELSKNEKYDLVISNYAFSECLRPVQDLYFEKVIRNSQRGYINWNFIIQEAGFNSYTIKDFTKKIKNSRIMTSKPHPFSKSRILFWDNTNPFLKNRHTFDPVAFFVKLHALTIFIRRWLFYPEVIKKEKEFLNFYSQFIGKDDLCFDIGANVGNKTKLFLKSGAKVVAVEPQKNCCRKMQRLYGTNENLIVINKGLADKPGYLDLSICDRYNGLSTMSEKWEKEGRFAHKYKWTKTQKVPVTTLDNLIAEYGLPKFCKIDVEESEPLVLKGLTKPIPYISFEFHREFFDNTKKCINHLLFLGSAGFNCAIGESRELLFPNWVSAAELYNRLGVIEDEDLWGDIYVKFVKF